MSDWYQHDPSAHQVWEEHPGIAHYPRHDTEEKNTIDEQTIKAYSYFSSHQIGSSRNYRHRNEKNDPTFSNSVDEKAYRGSAFRMFRFVYRAATADGANESGLTALIWPVIANFAADSAMAVGLANTLFFAAAIGESKSRVALYLLVTIAPFAMIAPLIGPALDRLQHGRRGALALSFIVRALLGIVLINHYHQGCFPAWILYPCALTMMVMSKSFAVLRSAVTPRVMPAGIDLVRVNSRLTVFGLTGGTLIGGGLAAIAEFSLSPLHRPGALFVLVLVSLAGAWSSMRIPRWVEVTAGEIPTALSYRYVQGHSGWREHFSHASNALRQPLGRNIIAALWGNCTIKTMVGFLFLYPAFVLKAHEPTGWSQIIILGSVGIAAGVGNFMGNFTAARVILGNPAQVVIFCASAVTGVGIFASYLGNFPAVVVATLVTSSSSAMAKASLDACLQQDLPEESRASAFGRTESTLQLAWVLGGALGVLVYTDIYIGFTTISSLLIPGLAQTILSFRGNSLIPGFGGNRPIVAAQEGSLASMNLSSYFSIE